MATMFPCPDCGGQLKFDIPKQKLKCQSCGNLHDVNTYKADDKIGTDHITTGVYQCPNCGGEIQLIDNDGMEFCPYCGSQATMQEKFSEYGTPKYIMPFEISKKQAKNRYEKATKGLHFAPDGLNDDDNIEKMVPLYVPYYIYEYSINDTVTYKGVKSYTKGSYDYVDKADVSVDLKVDSVKIPYDASQALDDSIAEHIEPFMLDNVENFNPNFLAGFFVENTSVDQALYQQESFDKATEYLKQQVTANSKGYSPDLGMVEPITSQIANSLKFDGIEGAYMPLYFLTTRYDDRVAYSIVNGVTGKLYTDMPIEKSKLFKKAAVVSLIIFAVLIAASFIFNFSFQVKNLCAVAAFVSSVIAFTGALLAKETYIRDLHLNDKGYFKSPENLSEEAKKQAKKKPMGTFGLTVALFLVMAMIAIVFIFGVAQAGALVSGMLYFCSVIFAILSLFTVKQGEKKVMLTGLVGWLLAIFIRLINLPNDVFYYGALIVAFVVIIYSIHAVVDEFNRFATRPSPQFMKKGGGLERA